MTNPNRELTYVLLWELGRSLASATWTKTDGYTHLYHTAMTEEYITSGVYSISAAGVMALLTDADNLTDLDAGAGGYYVTGGNIYIHDTVGNPTGQSRYWFFYFYDKFSTHEQSLDDIPYKGYLDVSSIPAVNESVSQYYSGGFQQSSGVIRLFNQGGYFDSRLSSYVHEGKRMTIKYADYGETAIANFTTMFICWSGNIVWSDESIEVTIEDYRRIRP